MSMKKIAVGIILLFIVTSVSPFVVGYSSNNSGSEYEELLDNLVFMCYDENSGNAKYEYYKKYVLNDCSNNDLDVVEVVKPVESSTVSPSKGPMDSAWPMLCHDNRHTGRSPYETGENPYGVEKWRFIQAHHIESSPVVDNDGIIYISNSWGELSAIYPDGTMKWKFTTEGQIMGSSPAIAEDGTLFIGTWYDFLYAINPNGTEKWKFDAHDTIASSPAIAEDGTIYFGTMGSGYNIYAINPNGTEKWHYPTGYKISSDPAIGDDGTVYIGSGDTYFYALYPNGTLRWRFPTGGVIKGPASIAEDGVIYIGSYDGYLYALYQNGSMKWRCSIGDGTENNPSIGEDGTIYVGDNNLYAIYPNGTMKWVFGLGNRHIYHSSPAVSADGTIYFGVEIGNMVGGEIVAVNADGTEQWRKRIANDWVASSPCIGEDGTVYIGSSFEAGKGYLHAFGSVEDNTPPNTPTIDGPAEGKAGVEYDYFISSIDPENNPVSIYIDWGDDTTSEWNQEYASGETAIISHNWEEEGTFTIGVKARDTLGEESDWGTLEVSMPVNQPVQFPIISWLLERFPNMFPLLQSHMQQIYQ